MIAKGPFTVKEMSKMLGKSDKTVYRMLESGKLKGYKDMDIWQIFLPNRNDYNSSVLDMSIPFTTHVLDTKSYTTDIETPPGGQATTQHGHFIKGLFVGLVLIVSIVYLLITMDILDIRWN